MKISMSNKELSFPGPGLFTIMLDDSTCLVFSVVCSVSLETFNRADGHSHPPKGNDMFGQ